MNPKVLIVILNYSTYEMTIELVEELKRLNYDSYRIMVVDNCSPNESAQVLASKADEMGFIFYANNKNEGYAAGNNIGIRYGIEHGFDYSWVLNNDVHIPDLNVLENMINLAEQRPEIGCVGPKIYNLDGKVCAPYCERPTLWTMTLGIFLTKKAREKQADLSQRVYRLHGCCMLLKNSVMKEIDCFDEETFLYGEEEILAERMLKIQKYMYYLAKTSIVHMESSTVKITDATKNKKRIRLVMNSMDYYLKEYRHFGLVARNACKWVRSIIMRVR